MPNWCANILEVSSPDAQVIEAFREQANAEGSALSLKNFLATPQRLLDTVSGSPPNAPPIEGRTVSTEAGNAWKPTLDADGNALGGIRLPPIDAPLGTYTGFDFSWLDPEVSKGHRYALVFAYGGSFKKFSDETLAERYPMDVDYRKAFEAAAHRVFDAGYILEEDLRRYTSAPR